MLDELRIADLGVIDEAVVEFSRGLTALTGETGAGKTMVVTGLGLLFGARSDPGLVQAGATRAAVDGHVRIQTCPDLLKRVEELGADLDDGLLAISRTIAADGRSRAQIGGRPVPISVLAEFGERLVAVHGQADQIRLRSPSAQRAALDAFGDSEHQRILCEYRETYREHSEAASRLDALRSETAQRMREAEMLRFALDELRRARVEPDEAARLVRDIERLAHADELAEALHTAHDALHSPQGDGLDVISLLAVARRALEKVSGHDPVLEPFVGQLRDIGYQLDDLVTGLSSYAAGIEADPAALAAAQERLATLRTLARKYTDGDIARLPEWTVAAAARLADIEGDDGRIGDLEKRVAELDSQRRHLAGQLSHARRAAATRFASAVTAEIRELALPHAVLDVAVRSDQPLGPHGADEVEFLFTAHPGAPVRPLAKAASGGELSRVMLAVEVVLAGADPVPTFLFDEVDAGIGGRAAMEVGRRLARLARRSQVIVVTHLPQVAAFADRHVVVVKSEDGRVTHSGVRCVEGSERLAELSRMLAGLEGSRLAEAHAAELLETAARLKQADGDALQEHGDASPEGTRRARRPKSTGR
ncbi:MAG: DNA repair protein RecN [Acidothermus cellulolyticus]|nr:DNA repair protein RecN [Acidothermus cellulolyticus]